MLYHISPIAGLKILQPHVSSHKKAYVYAIEDAVVGMLFGAPKDDFDFILSTDENGMSCVYECYPNAFQNVYEGKSCSVYEVSDEGFRRGMTSWSPELVSEDEVKVINEVVVEDLYQRLLKEEQRGSLKIHRYEHSDEYRRMISVHIVDRLIRFQVDLKQCLKTDRRFSIYYRGIIQELISIMDGHLLQ